MLANQTQHLACTGLRYVIKQNLLISSAGTYSPDVSVTSTVIPDPASCLFANVRILNLRYLFDIGGRKVRDTTHLVYSYPLKMAIDWLRKSAKDSQLAG